MYTGSVQKFCFYKGQHAGPETPAPLQLLWDYANITSAQSFCGCIIYLHSRPALVSALTHPLTLLESTESCLFPTHLKKDCCILDAFTCLHIINAFVSCSPRTRIILSWKKGVREHKNWTKNVCAKLKPTLPPFLATSLPIAYITLKPAGINSSKVPKWGSAKSFCIAIILSLAVQKENRVELLFSS